MLILNFKPYFAGTPVLLAFLALSPGRIMAEIALQQAVPKQDESALVRVNIYTETLGAGETVVINGKLITDYHPTIINVFPATGVVMDDRGNILTFLGYRWLDIQGSSPRIEIIGYQGEKQPGKLIGIDQRIGVAVISAKNGKFKPTPLCIQCGVRDGVTINTPVLEDQKVYQFETARVISAGQQNASGASEEWIITVNRPIQGVGEPILDSRHRVLGFVAGQKPSKEYPMGNWTVVYPISKLLASAEKILKTGGDIVNGWLGVYLDDSPQAPTKGVKVTRVINDSPAEKAGLMADDVLIRWHDQEVRDVRQFIQLVQESPIGSKVSVGVVRNGRQLLAQPVIARRKPPESPKKFIFSFPDELKLSGTASPSTGKSGNAPAPWTGIETVPLTPQLADFLQMPGKTGLLVLNVDPKAASSLAGMEVGDIILTVDGESVDNPKSLLSKLRSQGAGARMILRLLRKGVERVLTVQIPLVQADPIPQPKP